MTTMTTDFFDALARRGHEPLLGTTSGTVRIELENGARDERWLVTIAKGDVAVSHGNTPADCTIRADSALFAAIVDGEENALASVLRGAVEIEGDWGLLLAFQRLFGSGIREE